MSHIPWSRCCWKPAACICCKNCNDDVDKASAPIYGLHVCGGLVSNDELDVNDVAFGRTRLLAACNEPSNVAVVAAVAPFDVSWLVSESLTLVPVDSVSGLVTDAFEPLMVVNSECCIWWYFFCSLSFCVSANFTTNGAEHPSIVWLWCSPFKSKRRKSFKVDFHQYSKENLLVVNYLYGGHCIRFAWERNKRAAFALSTLIA